MVRQAFSVSVVIPLYNKANSISDAIQSVLSQTRKPDEIVIIDDGSTDDSVSIAKDALRSPNSLQFRIISQANSGVSAARNAGADVAASGFLAFLDADDEWLPGYLEEIQQLAEAFPDATVLTARNATSSPDGTLIPQATTLSGDFFGMVDRPLVRLSKGRGLIHSSSVTIRRDAWQRCGGFPLGASQGEDVFLWLKLAMTERMAHSGKTLSVFHAERSASGSRKDLIDYHFTYFLGTAEGRKHLANEDLRRFMSRHLRNRIFFRRLGGHSEVQRELRQLALSLPPGWRIACLLASVAPMPALRILQWIRTRILGRRAVTNC